MRRSFPLLRSNLRAIKDSISYGHKVLWMGWLCLAVMFLNTVVFWLVWKGMLATVLGNVVSVLPLQAGEETRFTIMLIGSMLIYVLVSCWVFSMCWIHADSAAWRQGGRERLMAKSLPLAGALARIFGVGLGVAAIGWFLDVAVASRLEASVDDAHLIVLAVYGVLLLPLTIRLWYLPPMAAIESDNAAGPWGMLLQTTNGRGIDLLATVLLQGVVLVVSAVAFRSFVSDLGAPLYDVATSGDFKSASELATALRSQISSELLHGLMLWFLVSGPVVMLVAAMQVATLRSLVGVASGGFESGESHFALGDDGTEEAEERQSSERRGASTPDEADPLQPQFEQLGVPESGHPGAAPPQIEESRALPDELVNTANLKEPALNRSADQASSISAEAPAPAAVPLDETQSPIDYEGGEALALQGSDGQFAHPSGPAGSPVPEPISAVDSGQFGRISEPSATPDVLAARSPEASGPSAEPIARADAAPTPRPLPSPQPEPAAPQRPAPPIGSRPAPMPPPPSIRSQDVEGEIRDLPKPALSRFRKPVD